MNPPTPGKGKEIRDFLHLYLGCEAIVEQSDYHMVHNMGIHKGDTIVVTEKIIAHLRNVKPLHAVIKLCLRPLSDMTEEEKIILMDKFNLWPLYIPEKRIEIFNRHVADSNFWSPDIFLYLLSRRFDLFNLINDGLAIDKTKQS